MTMVFINLPVRSAAAAQAFWNSLGYATNPQFTDERTSNVSISESIHLMLLEHSRFADFVTGPIADRQAGTSAIYALSAPDRDAVDSLTEAALSAGASDWQPVQDLGFMYGRSFQDPDGHVWEVIWMDAAVVEPHPTLEGASN